MDSNVSKFSFELRDVLVKAFKDDFFTNNTPKLDRVFLAERFKSIVDNFNGFILISNYLTGLYEYISDGIYTHLGYDLKNYTNEAMTDFIISLIKPEHRDFMMNLLLPTVFKYFHEHSTKTTGTDYRYTCCMKVRNVQGDYVWYLVDTVLIETDEKGFPVRTLVTATNIDQFKKDEQVYYNILKKNSAGVYEVMLEGTADNNLADLQLTSRELQIISLISQGLTNKQIAGKLFISLNTVQTHRKNIMRKTQCANTADLTNFAVTRGLL